jgi:DNA-binding GntR family transcriptional regulator
MQTNVRRPRHNLKDEVATHLRDLILSGEYRPGQKIDQDQIAEELGLSKLPVREALITLETEGLVENIARRGAFVAALTPDDVIDHYTMYGLLSGMAARRAAANLTEDELADLETVLSKMEASTDPSEQETLNWRFHEILNRAGGSRRLLSVLRLLSRNIPSRFFEVTTDWPDHAHADHRRILDALQHRDGEAACTAMSDHLREGATYAVNMLRSAGFWEDGEDGEDGNGESGAASSR